MSSNTREIVTFQIGHFSNFIGTHSWNLQESTFVYSAEEVKYPKEVNHDVLFREGKNLSGEITYTPRLIALDLKGSLNTLKQDGILYDLRGTEEDVLWRNDVTLHKLDVSVQKNEFLRDLDADNDDKTESGETEKDSEEGSKDDEIDKDTTRAREASSEAVFGRKYYDLDGSVRVWSDFLRLHLHPRSVHVVEQYRHGEDTFDLFGYGEQVYRDTRAEIEDRAHFFLEECDNLQGMQMVVDMYDGFGGLASSLMEELCDDYTGKSVLLYSVTPTVFPGNSIASECYRVLNTALCLDKVLPHSAAVLPLSLASTLWRRHGAPRALQHLKYQPDLAYHSSAILGAAVENMTTPFRLETSPMLLPHLTDSMVIQGRKVVSLQSSFPLARKCDQYLVDYLWELGDTPPWQSLTPYCSPAAQPIAQSVVLQGVRREDLKGPPDPRLPAAVNNSRSIEDIMSIYLADVYSTPLNTICCLRRPCPVTTPFPHVFDQNISTSGELAPKPRPPKTGVEEVPMMTSLQATNDASNYVTALVNEISKYKIKKFHKYLDNGLEEDSFKEVIENLKTLNRCYSNEKETESDDDYDID